MNFNININKKKIKFNLTRGLIKTKWHTDTISHYMADGDYVTVNAVFDDLTAARICAGFQIEENQVLSRTYIYE